MDYKFCVLENWTLKDEINVLYVLGESVNIFNSTFNSLIEMVQYIKFSSVSGLDFYYNMRGYVLNIYGKNSDSEFKNSVRLLRGLNTSELEESLNEFRNLKSS